MNLILRQFSTSFALCVIALSISILLAGLFATRAVRDGRDPWRAAFRVLALGFAAIILAATALPQSWPPVSAGTGRVMLEVGQGGLADLKWVLRAPTSWPAAMLMMNVVLYVPFGLLGALAWPQRKWLVLAVGLFVSLAVESSQMLWARVAATDDFILNATGLLIGWAAGLVLLRLGFGRRTGVASER